MEENLENLEEFDRGLLSEINGEYYFNDLEPQEPDSCQAPQEPEICVAPMGNRDLNISMDRSKVSAKVLKHLGLVVYSDPAIRDSRSWLLQSLLNELEYPLTPDGYFGEKTKKQVEKFQTACHLVADGKVGENTWAELIYRGKCKISNSKITQQDFEDAAKELYVEVAVVKAVTEVEAGGSGYLFSNHPTILFEGHVFYKLLNNSKLLPKLNKENENILYPKWTKSHYIGGVGEYDRLQKARWINRDAANKSASWGLFQIMGNNFAACGCSTVEEFVQRMCKSESEQLRLFVAFIQHNKLDRFLRNKDWAGFAYRYNGAGYGINEYDKKLMNAYNKHKKQSK